MEAFGKRHQRPSFPSADSWADKYPGSGTLSRRLPRTTQLNISRGMPSNNRDSKIYAYLLSDTRHHGQTQGWLLLSTCVHTIGDETPLVTVGQAAGGRYVKPHLASKGKAVLSSDTNPPPPGDQWQGWTCPEPQALSKAWALRHLHVSDSRFLRL